MAYRRPAEPNLLQGDALTAAMVGIGVGFAATAAPEVNIEDTLLAASIEGMEHDDLRVLAALTTWLGVHHQRINADRLIRIVVTREEQRVLAYWAAVAHWLNGDRRLSRLTEHAPKERVHLLRVGSTFQLKRRGEDPRFDGSPLVVPQGVLRDREADVLAPQQLAERHRAYFQRVQMGPSYRADLWALLEREPSLSPSELARRGYGSFATAWQVKRDFETLHRPQDSSACRSPSVGIPANIDPKLRKEAEGVLAALRRARRRAEDLAIATGTCLVESKDGKPVLVSAAEILERRKKANGPR